MMRWLQLVHTGIGRPISLTLLKQLGPHFPNFLGKSSEDFFLGQSLTISGKTLTRHNFSLLTNSRLNNDVT